MILLSSSLTTTRWKGEKDRFERGKVVIVGKVAVKHVRESLSLRRSNLQDKLNREYKAAIPHRCHQHLRYRPPAHPRPPLNQPPPPPSPRPLPLNGLLEKDTQSRCIRELLKLAQRFKVRISGRHNISIRKPIDFHWLHIAINFIWVSSLKFDKWVEYLELAIAAGASVAWA
jgi:hypothetical protein